jgi:hypothetical protein
MILSLCLSACFLVPAEDPMTLAQSLLTTGAALFDKHDAAAMAATYVENGEIQILIKEQSGDTYKRDTRTGRAAIQDGYAEVFKNATPSMRSRNVVESAKFIGQTYLLIEGTFQPDTNKTDTVSFVQVRVKDGGAWKILSVHLYVPSQN